MFIFNLLYLFVIVALCKVLSSYFSTKRKKPASYVDITNSVGQATEQFESNMKSSQDAITNFREKSQKIIEEFEQKNVPIDDSKLRGQLFKTYPTDLSISKVTLPSEVTETFERMKVDMDNGLNNSSLESFVDKEEYKNLSNKSLGKKKTKKEKFKSAKEDVDVMEILNPDNFGPNNNYTFDTHPNFIQQNIYNDTVKRIIDVRNLNGLEKIKEFDYIRSNFYLGDTEPFTRLEKMMLERGMKNLPGNPYALLWQKKRFREIKSDIMKNMKNIEISSLPDRDYEMMYGLITSEDKNDPYLQGKITYDDYYTYFLQEMPTEETDDIIRMRYYNDMANKHIAQSILDTINEIKAKEFTKENFDPSAVQPPSIIEVLESNADVLRNVTANLKHEIKEKMSNLRIKAEQAKTEINRGKI